MSRSRRPIEPGNPEPPPIPQPERDDVSKLASGAGTSLAGRLGGRGIQVVAEVILARLLGPAAFGLYTVGWSLLRVIGLLCPLGLNKGVIKLGTDFWNRDAARFRGVLLESILGAFLSGVAAGILVFLAAPFLAERVFEKPETVRIIRVFALAFPLYSALQVAAAATRITHRIVYSALAEDLLQPASFLVLFLLAYSLGGGVLAAAAAAVVSFGLALALASVFVRQLFPSVIDPKHGIVSSRRSLVRFSLPASLAGMSLILILWIDRLILASHRPAEEVGIYQAVSQPAFLISVVLAAFNAIFAPMIAELARRGEMERIDRLFKISTKWALYLEVPLFLVVLLAPASVIAGVYGSDYLPGVAPMMVLAAGQFVNTATGTVGFLLIMTGRQSHWMKISFAVLALDVALNLLLVPAFGMTGAAVATATSIGFLVLGGLLSVRHLLGIWPYDVRYFKGIGAAFVTVIVLLGIEHLAQGSPAFTSLAMLVAATAVFYGTMLSWGADEEDRQVALAVWRRLRGRASR